MRQSFEGYSIDQDPEGFGNVIALTSPWNRKYLGAIAKHRVKVILLSEYNGWTESEVSFLRDMPLIEGVEIVSEKVTDVTLINGLKSLRMLSLACKTKVPVDLSGLQRLQSVFLVWRNAYTSVFVLNSMTKINIVDYPNGDLSLWKENDSLRELLIASKNLASLFGISRFRNLERLDLFGCSKLHSLCEIEASSTIRKLKIQKCPGIKDLEPVSSLIELRKLALKDCGMIRSLAPLAKCKKLEFLQIAGSTTVLDGDFSSLAGLPNLEEVLLAKKKHYTHLPEGL